MTFTTATSMRTAAYCRYSSDEQRAASIRDQLRNIEEACRHRGWPMPALFVDEAISGSRLDRPNYQALLTTLRDGLVDVLLVDDYTRLGRDHLECGRLLRELEYLKVRLVSVSDGLDTDREGYEIEAGLRGLMGEWYLRDLAKKTHRGLTGQALAGYSAGGGPYGYTSVSDGHGHRLQPIDAEAQVVRLIFDMYVSGTSCRSIAEELNRQAIPSPRGGTWAHSALYPDAKGVGILGNQVYNGRMVWNKTKWQKDPTTGRRRRTQRPPSEWIITEHAELKIIDDEIWAAAQARTESTRLSTLQRKSAGIKGSGGRRPKYLLSGLLHCGSCGGKLVICDYYRYGCSINKDRGETVCPDKGRYRRDVLERTLLESVKKDLLSPVAWQAFQAELREQLHAMKPNPSRARRELAKAREVVANIMAAIKMGIVTPSTKEALQAAEAQQLQAKAELEAMERFEPAQILPRAREIYQQLASSLENIDDVATARESLRALLGDIRIVRDGTATYAEMTNAGLAGVCSISVVAGAGFEPTTFGL